MVLQGNVRQTHSHRSYGGPSRYFRLLIHPDVEDFRAAAHRYTGQDFNEAIGCCHPAPVRERYDRHLKRWVDAGYRHWGGVIRLTAGRITSEVVTHEMVHAALAIYRMDIAVQPRFANGCDHKEERLAYIIGDLTQQASDELHRLKAWS